MAVIDTRPAAGFNFFDQPWVQTWTVEKGPDARKDRLYVGCNDLTIFPAQPHRSTYLRTEWPGCPCSIWSGDRRRLGRNAGPRSNRVRPRPRGRSEAQLARLDCVVRSTSGRLYAPRAPFFFKIAWPEEEEEEELDFGGFERLEIKGLKYEKLEIKELKLLRSGERGEDDDESHGKFRAISRLLRRIAAGLTDDDRDDEDPDDDGD